MFVIYLLSASHLFFELLEDFANTRRELAVESKTPDAKDFGTRRDVEGVADVSFTWMTGRYLECGQSILQHLTGWLSGLYQDQKWMGKNWVREETFLGRTSSVEIRIFEKEDLEKEGFYPGVAREELPKGFPLELFHKQVRTEEESIKLSSALHRLRRQSPETYHRLRMGSLISLLMQDCPSPIWILPIGGWVGNLDYLKSFYVLTTVRLEIAGKMQPLFQYFTWGYQNSGEDPLERMQKCSSVLLVHQHASLLQQTLEDAAQIFTELFDWDGKDLMEFKKKMALFRFEMTCMPFLRGSAMISEWLEAAICTHHGMPPENLQSADLTAYAHPFLSEFFNQKFPRPR